MTQTSMNTPMQKE